MGGRRARTEYRGGINAFGGEALIGKSERRVSALRDGEMVGDGDGDGRQNRMAFSSRCHLYKSYSFMD